MRLAFLIPSLLLSTPALAAKPTVAVAPVQLDDSAHGQVPDLIDDYVLSAVQDLGQFEVIGQDDINALVGLEKQKELLGCDDVSCFADIGGALGVEKIVVFKVARVGEQWATTAKVIATKPPRVEARLSRFVEGDTAALLKAVAAIIGELFGQSQSASESPPVAQPAAASATAEASTTWELDLIFALYPWYTSTYGSTLNRGDEVIGDKYILLTPRLQGRHNEFGRLSLLAQATLGLAFARLYSADPEDGTVYDNDTATAFFSLMEVARYTLVRGAEAWGGLSSDRVAVDVGAGPYVDLSSAVEFGVAAQLELRVFWLSAGVLVTYGTTTAVDVGFPISLRFGF